MCGSFKSIILFCIFVNVFHKFSLSQYFNPETIAIHYPIYPSDSERVTFILNRLEGNIDTVKLYISESTLDNTGNIKNVKEEQLIKFWTNPSFPLNDTSISGFGKNKLVTYRFEVSGNGIHYNHKILFATSPYPIINDPAPVYIVGDVNCVLNCVFIPDIDLVDNLPLFYKSVFDNIDSTFHLESFISRFRNSYNYFINPISAVAGTKDSVRDSYRYSSHHKKPLNRDSLKFAEAKIILHKSTLLDFANNGYVGSEYFNRGDILHETGHSLYRLHDEYEKGFHNEESFFPNNWKFLINAQKVSYIYNKPIESAKEINDSKKYSKLCDSSCSMNNAGLNIFPYDTPCKFRILKILSDKAGFKQDSIFQTYNEKKKIEMLNNFTELNNSKFNPTFLIDVVNKYIDVQYAVFDKKLNVDITENVHFRGNINEDNDSSRIINLRFEDIDNNIVNDYFIAIPPVIRICGDKSGIFKFNGEKSEIYVPSNSNITKIKINNNNLKDDFEHINLIIEKYKNVYKIGIH